MTRRCTDKKKRTDGAGIINLEHPERYRPWIQSRELKNGSGRRYIVPCKFCPERMVHLMSGLEKSAYDMLIRKDKVTGIFEQVALELEDTIQICSDFGYIHPRIQGTNQLHVMSTDFVVCVDDGRRKLLAYAVKPSSDLENERTLEKLKIEQEYWKRKNIHWEIITEQHI